MDRKEAIRLVYGDKAVEDYDKYEYRLPSEQESTKPKCEVEVWCYHTAEWTETSPAIQSLYVNSFYRWPKQQKRWWFNTQTKSVYQADGLEEMPPHILEVTESYARCLSNKPDAECELRQKAIDCEYLRVDGKWTDNVTDPFDCFDGDLGYRWVKTSSLKIVDVVDGLCDGYALILRNPCGIDDYVQAGYIYDNGQESPHSWLWQDPRYPKHHYAGARSSKYSKPVTPVKVVCARRER
jgi:hypothetical protein